MQQTKLYYFFDPLCGWCYGFSPVIQALEKEYETIQFEPICGGMILGERVKPLTEMKPYLSEAIPRLEEMTGVKIGEEYLKLLDDNSVAPSSELPSIAMLVYKSMKADSAISFASSLQKQLFVHGKDLNKRDNYESIRKEFGLDEEIFYDRLESESFKEKAYKEFGMSQQSGISGFPSVALMHDGKGYLIAKGYRPAKEMRMVIDQILSENKQ